MHYHVLQNEGVGIIQLSVSFMYSNHVEWEYRSGETNNTADICWGDILKKIMQFLLRCLWEELENKGIVLKRDKPSHFKNNTFIIILKHFQK